MNLFIFRISQKFSFLPVQFSRCAGLCPDPFAAAVALRPVDLLRSPCRRSRLLLGFEVPLSRTLKTIQTRDLSLRFCSAFQSDCRPSLSLGQLYTRSYGFRLPFLIPRSAPASALASRPRPAVSSTWDPDGFPCRPALPRKEVIQPHLPIRLPCYDFTPVIGLTFGSWLLSVTSLTSGAPNSHGVTGGVYTARERIHRGMLIRDY